MSVLRSVARVVVRVALAMSFIAIPLILFKLAIKPALGLDRRVPLTEAITTDPMTFYINIGTTLLIIVLGYWAYVRVIERRSVEEFSPRAGAMFVGLASGLFLIGLPILVLYSTGHYESVSYEGFSDATIAITLIVVIAALLEEIVFRGIFFGVIERHFGTIVALFVQSSIFSAVHLANDNWAGFLPVVSGFLIGCLWTCLYIVFRNIWMVALHHAAWNLTIFATGLPLSGIDEWRQAAPFQSEFHGSALITGGMSGPEVSILTPVVVLLAFGALLYWARKKNLILRPPGDTAPILSH